MGDDGGRPFPDRSCSAIQSSLADAGRARFNSTILGTLTVDGLKGIVLPANYKGIANRAQITSGRVRGRRAAGQNGG